MESKRIINKQMKKIKIWYLRMVKENYRSNEDNNRKSREKKKWNFQAEE